MGPSGREGSGEEVNLEVANMGEAASTEEGDVDAIKEDEAASTEEGDADATKEGEASTAEVEMKDPKIHTRSSPNSVILAAQELSSDARNVVITAGFEQLLYMSLEGFGNREILRFLMNNTHTEQTSEGVEIKIEGSKLPPITENVVAHVVGVPEGSGESLEFEQDTKKQGEIKKAVHNLLKLPDSVDDCEPIADEKKRDRKHKTIMNGKIGVDYLRDVMEEAKETKDVELEVKCFFFIAFHTLLLPKKDGYLTLHQMQAGMNLARIQRINWRKVLLNHLKDGVKSWWKSQAKSTKPGAKSTKPGGVASVYISGPVTVLLLYYLDFLKSKSESDVSQTPRICYYGESMVTDLVQETMQKDGKRFDNLKFRTTEETCYSRSYNECEKVKVQKVSGKQKKNKRTRLGKNKGEKGDKEEKGTHVNPAVRRKEVVKRYGERAEKDSGAKNDMVAHIPALEDFVKSSLEHMPRYLHSDAIKTVKQNHSSIVEMYEKIMKTQSQMPSKMESLVDRYKDLDEFYSKHIMSKADWEQKHFGNKAAVDINGITIAEHDFVKSMKLNGWISNFIVDVQCSIWREEEEWKDKIILSQSAVNELLGLTQIRGYVEKELSNLAKKKQIFVPILVRALDGSGLHWYLLVVDIENGIRSDCGFYMLLYMERFGRMKIDDINEDIYENPNNNPKDVSDEVIAQDEYHILDDTICLSPPPSDLRNSPPRPNLTVSPMSHEDGRNDGPLPPSSPGTSDGNKNLEDAQPQEEADRSSVGIAENAEAGNQANHARTSDGNQKLDDAQAQGKANRSSEGSSLDTRTDNERSRTSDDEAGGNEVDEGEKGVPSSPPRREQNPSHALDKDIVYYSRKKKEKKRKEKSRSSLDNDLIQLGKRCRIATTRTAIKTTRREWPDDAIVKEVYELATDCKEQVILNFGAIAMTGSEIEQSFQKVECAGDIISLFIKYLENNTYPDDSRIFVPPLYKGKGGMKKKIKDALGGSNEKKSAVEFPHRFPNDSVFAAMYFLEHFIGVAGVLNKLTWDEKMRDQYIKSYSRGILTCLIQHKENTADVPDGILALLE
ncbi:Os06g0122600 [Oryza sativa Japonica Group]|uniref:Os06g0122600 protein n=1 Tax=Oryza sativa subsp. japonica TaxID=39947 RepID=Q5VQC7_ORYSJ|nr:unknown protein [Oryza sativa Japonica Group]BAH93305.1 Os06g0122600 [Oryza sativa Japonica Group]|eukprot:NP_001174577.1 Os06g0122600 [Oryza sativa Japonica Group]